MGKFIWFNIFLNPANFSLYFLTQISICFSIFRHHFFTVELRAICAFSSALLPTFAWFSEIVNLWDFFLSSRINFNLILFILSGNILWSLHFFSYWFSWRLSSPSWIICHNSWKIELIHGMFCRLLIKWAAVVRFIQYFKWLI